MKVRGTRGFSVGLFQGSEDFGIGSGHKNVVARVFFLEHGVDDFGNLLWRLALGEHDFGEALTEGAVMVHLGKAEVLERKMLQALDGRGGREFPALHRFQNFQ